MALKTVVRVVLWVAVAAALANTILLEGGRNGLLDDNLISRGVSVAFVAGGAAMIVGRLAGSVKSRRYWHATAYAGSLILGYWLYGVFVVHLGVRSEDQAIAILGEAVRGRIDHEIIVDEAALDGYRKLKSNTDRMRIVRTLAVPSDCRYDYLLSFDGSAQIAATLWVRRERPKLWIHTPA